MRAHYTLKGAVNLRAEHRNEKFKNNKCMWWFDILKDMLIVNCPCLRLYFKNRTQDMNIEKDIRNSNWSKVEERRKKFVDKSLSENKITRKGVDHLISSLLNRREFKYTNKDLLQWALCCVVCRRKENVKKWMVFEHQWRFQ